MIKKEDITANIMLVQVRGLSVFGTGHEFNDRNSELEPNILLIRTTCLYSAEVELAAHNRRGHEDGFLRLGTSKFGCRGRTSSPGTAAGPWSADTRATWAW